MTKPRFTRREVQLNESDSALLKALSQTYGSESQAIRVAIRRLSEEKK